MEICESSNELQSVLYLGSSFLIAEVFFQGIQLAVL